jgi:hypothetical protein
MRCHGLAGGGIQPILYWLLQNRHDVRGQSGRMYHAQSFVIFGLLVRLRDEYTLVVHGHALLSGSDLPPVHFSDHDHLQNISFNSIHCVAHFLKIPV